MLTGDEVPTHVTQIYKNNGSGEFTKTQDLADAVGVSRQTIVAIEKSKYSPTLELAFKISNVFDCPIGEVFSYIPGEESKKE